MGFSDELLALFGKSNPYEILEIPSDCSPQVLKRAYFRFAKLFHPDKSSESETDSTQKFQAISKLYGILSDEAQRKLYDETKSFNDDVAVDVAGFEKRVTDEEIVSFRKSYQGSEEELRDLKTVFIKVQGNMSKLFEFVMCSDPLDDEERFREIINTWIETKEVSAYPAYVKENPKKRAQRASKAKREKQEVDAGKEDELSKLILSKMSQRKDGFSSICEKYEKEATKPKRSKKSQKD